MQHNTNPASVKALVIDSLAMVDPSFKPVIDVEMTEAQQQAARNMAQAFNNIPTGMGRGVLSDFLRKFRQEELEGPVSIRASLAALQLSTEGLRYDPRTLGQYLTITQPQNRTHIRKPLNVVDLLIGPIKGPDND